MKLLMVMLAIMAVVLLGCSKASVEGIGSGTDVVKKPSGSGCTDTDGGNNPNAGGQVNGVRDTCIGSNMLIEQYCENGKPATQNYRCENVCDPVDHRCY
jgi:hypothetical protein